MSPRKRQTGYVLFTALIVILVLSVLTTTVLTLVLNDSMQLNRTEARLEAHYRALSGVEVARAILEKDSTKNLRGIFGGRISDSEGAVFEFLQPFDLGEYWEEDTQVVRDAVIGAIQSEQTEIAFAILSSDDDSEVKIVSYGNRNSVLESIVLNLAFTGGGFEFPIFDMAVFSDSYIGLGGSARIEGRAGTNSVTPGTVDLYGGGVMVTDTIYVGVDGDVHVNPSPDPDAHWIAVEYPDAVVTRSGIWNNTWLNSHPIQNLDQYREYVLPEFPDAPPSISFPSFPDFPGGLPDVGNLSVGGNKSATVSESAEYGSISVGGSAELIFNLSGRDLSIRASSLNISGSGKISVIGPGTLNMYVDGNVSISGNGITSQNSGRFNLYVNGSFNSSGNNNVELANLYTKGLTDLGNSGQMTVENLYVDSNQGFSTSGNGTLRISSEFLVKASSASFSSGIVDFMNGSRQEFQIANTMSLTGNAVVNGISNGVINCASLNVGQGHINLAEEGDLEVYASTGFNMGGSSTLNNGGDRESVRVDYAGTNNLDLTGNIRYTGVLNILQADADLGGSGEIDGLVISGGPNVNLHGNPLAKVIAIYAPNSTVNMVGSATVRGAIVAERFVAGGSSKVVFESETEELFPPGTIGLGDEEGQEDTEFWSR